MESWEGESMIGVVRALPVMRTIFFSNDAMAPKFSRLTQSH